MNEPSPPSAHCRVFLPLCRHGRMQALAGLQRRLRDSGLTWWAGGKSWSQASGRASLSATLQPQQVSLTQTSVLFSLRMHGALLIDFVLPLLSSWTLAATSHPVYDTSLLPSPLHPSRLRAHHVCARAGLAPHADKKTVL